MTDREKILGRIREALTVEAPMPGQHHGHGSHKPGGASPSTQAREWLPAVGDSAAAEVAAFRENAVGLKADFQIATSRDELAALLCKLRDAEGWKKIAAHHGELADAVCAALGLPVLKTDGGYDVHELEKCDAAITECDALVAQTGSVLVTSRSAGGRALSVLPPHHVVIARREQLLRDLPAAFQFLKRKYGANYPSMISFITGPSRTGDIERILVLGAHGPKKLTIFMV
jgi:L-lactate dehydrogenase complex protein LldG